MMNEIKSRRINVVDLSFECGRATVLQFFYGNLVLEPAAHELVKIHNILFENVIIILIYYALEKKE